MLPTSTKQTAQGCAGGSCCACLRLAARVGLLDGDDGCSGNRQRFAAVILLADQIPFWLRGSVAAETVAAEAIHDFGNAANLDLAGSC